MNKIILIHYHEIALKGKNRPFFERALLNNIKASLSSEMYSKVQIIFGRMVVWMRDDVDEQEIEERLKKVFGIANFSFGWVLPADFSSFSEEAVKILKEIEFENFRITARRAGKDFPMSSQEVNEQLGALVVQKLGKKVNLENPDINCFLEIVDSEAFLYFEKKKGLCGLPVGVSRNIGY